MYCKKCGKEIKDGAAFCKFCGERIKAEAQSGTGNGMFAQMPLAPLPGAAQKNPQTEKKPFSIPQWGIALAALVFVVIVAGLIFAVAGNKGKKEIRQAEKYLEEGNYEKALECCEEVLEKDEQYAEAYLLCADIHIAMEAYGNAIADLDEYFKKAGEKESEEYKETFDEKRAEIYQKQEEHLVGVWKLSYDLKNLIPKDYRDYFADYTIPIEPAPILVEFNSGGSMRLSVEPEYFDGMRETLSSLASLAATAAAKLPIGKAAGWLTDIVTGLLVDSAGVSFDYNVVEDKLYCISGDGTEEFYLFEIDGGTLTFRSCSQEKYYLDFPLVLERVE